MFDFVDNLTPKLRAAPTLAPAVPLNHFRVHFADGTKHDVLAKCADDAARHARKLSDAKITKTKLIREKAAR